MKRAILLFYFIVPILLLITFSCKTFTTHAKKKTKNMKTTTSTAYVCADVEETDEITITDETLSIQHSQDGNATIKGTILTGVGNPNQYYFPNDGEQKVRPGRYMHKADGMVVKGVERQCVYSTVTYK